VSGGNLDVDFEFRGPGGVLASGKRQPDWLFEGEAEATGEYEVGEGVRVWV